MSLPRLAVVLAFATPLAAAPGDKAPAPGEDLLALTSEKVLFALQIHGVERAQDRLHAFLKAAVPDLADRAAQNIRERLTELLEGRDLKALRGDGRILIAISDLDPVADKAGITFLFPVQSADAFRRGFLTEPERASLKKDGDLEQLKFEDQEVPFFLVELKEYVVVSADRDLATAYAKGTLAGVNKQVSAEVARQFHAGDVSLFVNVTTVQAKFGDQLKRYKALAEALLKGETVQGVSKGQLEQIKGMLDTVFKLAEDGTAAVLTAAFDPGGLRLKGLAQFGAKSATAATLQKYKLSAFDTLGTLPPGQAVYSASNLSLGGTAAAGLVAGGFTADDDHPAAKETIAGLLKELQESDHGLALSAGNLLAAGGLEVAASTDAAKIVETRLKVLKALTATGSFANVALKAKPEMKENAEKVGAFTLHAVTLTYDLDRATADLPAETRETTKASLKRALGGDVGRIWFGTDGKTVLQIASPDWAAAKALAEGYLAGGPGVGKDDAFQATRKQLPAEASMIALLDAGRAAHAVLGTLRVSPDAKAPAVKQSYVGVALVLTAGHGSFDIFVPAAAVGPVRALVGPLLDNAD